MKTARIKLIVAPTLGLVGLFCLALARPANLRAKSLPIVWGRSTVEISIPIGENATISPANAHAPKLDEPAPSEPAAGQEKWPDTLEVVRGFDPRGPVQAWGLFGEQGERQGRARDLWGAGEVE